ncbi:MAG: CBS domain-containing protein [Herpetosiphon sp.]
MDQRVNDVMHRGVVSCTDDTPVAHVAATMRDNDISCVVVLSGNDEIRGIITQSDIIKSLGVRHFERRPWNLLAEHIMTPEVVTITAYTALDEASQLMTERHIHRLVVVDPAQPSRAIGICSMSDIIRALADEPSEPAGK